MNRFVICVLLLVQYGMSFAQPAHEDSLLAHYPLRVGNVWDYRGSHDLGIGLGIYPTLTFRSVIDDSLHNNGKRYKIMNETMYGIFGQLQPGALGTIYRYTYLQRIDSLTLNVWQNFPGSEDLAGGELMIDSLRAEVGDLIQLNGDFNDILEYYEREDSFLFGRMRSLRKLIVANPIIGHSFSNAEGLGEVFWEYSEGDATTNDLQGAVIQGDTLGILVRSQPPKLLLSTSQLDFSPDRRSRTVYFRNPGLGLTIVDSVALAHDHLFTLQPSYNSATFGSGWFQKGPFLIFPSDSIRIDLALIPENIPGQAFIDTFRVYAHGLNGEILPEMKMSLAFSPTVAVEQKDQSGNVPRQIALKIYPNPSNAQVTITFEPSERGRATIRVVNVLGREVAVLLNEAKPAGMHRISWDPQELNTGIYFIELEAVGERRVQKWLLLK